MMDEKKVKELVNKLKNEGLITAKDSSDLSSRVRSVTLYDDLLQHFAEEDIKDKLVSLGKFFGGYVVDSYAIFYKDNEFGLVYDEAVKEFEKENNEINRQNPTY